MRRDTWKLGSTHYIYFNTHKGDGTRIAYATTLTVDAYVDGSVTQLPAVSNGTTPVSGLDSVVGLNCVAVVLTAANGYTADTDVAFVVSSASTVDSVSITGTILKEVRVASADADGIVSQGTLAAGGSVTAFTLPAGQRTNVQVGDYLKPAGLPARAITAYNSGTGVGATDAFVSDPSSLAYVVWGSAPAATTRDFSATEKTSVTTAATAATPSGVTLAATQTGVTIPTVTTVGTVTTLTNHTYGCKKNAAKANFPFVMRDATTHLPKTGLTVSGHRSIDGAAYAATATATATEVGNGSYKLSLAAADLNGDTIILRFTATGADDLFVTVLTEA